MNFLRVCIAVLVVAGMTSEAFALVPLPRVQNSRCGPVVGKTLQEIEALDVEIIKDCIEKGYEAPIITRPDVGMGRGVNIGGGGPTTHRVGKCSPDECYSSVGGEAAPSGAPGAWPPTPNTPPAAVSGTGIPSLPCGGAVSLPQGILNTLGGFGVNIPSQVGSVVNSLFPSSCNGGLLRLAQNALNLILPPNTRVNIINGRMQLPGGSVLRFPPGSTLTLDGGIGGTLRLPDGARINYNGEEITVASQSSITMDSDGTLRISDGRVFPGNGVVTVSPGSSADGGGSVELPEGASLPAPPAGTPVIQPTPP